MGKRRKGREIVLQSLYASLMGGGDVTAVVEDQLVRRESSPETSEFARDLARKIKANRPDLERWLATLVSARWDPARLGTLERCILLLGLTELKHSPAVPFRAVINEACELAHRYCEDGAVGFINGVLDRAAHQMYPEAAGTHAGAADAAAIALAGADPLDGPDSETDPDLDADFGDTPLRGAVPEAVGDVMPDGDPGKDAR